MDLFFGRNGRLRYNENYAVLICLECKYAVQKNAIESHLLRHKIYRGERKTLLAEIAKRHLTEPDDVVLPSVIAAPVDGLAVIPGYRCMADGCEALCASSKRMRRHWSEAHGTTDIPLASMATEAHLQTFFRGTKLKYFQVLADDTTSVDPLRSVSAESPGSPAASVDAGDAFFQALVSQQTSVRVPLQVEMETLQYFYHFTNTGVVARAVQLRWLMCGILATSATHKRTQARGRDAQNIHSDRADQFQAEFLGSWPTQQGVIEGPAIELGAQLRCIQRLCQITWPSPTSTMEEMDIFEWPMLTKTIRGCLDPAIAIQTAPYPSPYPLPPAAKYAEARILASTVPNHAPPSLLKSLRELPFRMAVALTKPDSQEDLLAVVSAIDILMDCFIISYASENDGGTAAWLGMECWLREVPEHFNGMLSRNLPAALIVLAHWSLLVRRAERYYWFMQGLWEKVRDSILRQVPNDTAIRELIDACRTLYIP
ncbi:hypothetical protein NLG97_g2228 [Lecanicillium saksenae]|uniref:Uncharacterized protein n=1 Tax=Lecanicillium saksenae TaxID=468837 RepID=A0ACC1R470_9HYPO|nr:hypothetical protein NLG97_g2228 [Lecanicillium saksenae]